MKSLLAQVLTVHEQTNINTDSIGAGQSSIQRAKAMREKMNAVDWPMNSSVISKNTYPLPDQLTLSSTGSMAGNFAKIEFS